MNLNPAVMQVLSVARDSEGPQGKRFEVHHTGRKIFAREFPPFFGPANISRLHFSFARRLASSKALNPMLKFPESLNHIGLELRYKRDGTNGAKGKGYVNGNGSSAYNYVSENTGVEPVECLKNESVEVKSNDRLGELSSPVYVHVRTLDHVFFRSFEFFSGRILLLCCFASLVNSSQFESISSRFEALEQRWFLDFSFFFFRFGVDSLIESFLLPKGHQELTCISQVLILYVFSDPNWIFSQSFSRDYLVPTHILTIFPNSWKLGVQQKVESMG